LPFQNDDLKEQAKKQGFNASEMRSELKNAVSVLSIEKRATSSDFENQKGL